MTDEEWKELSEIAENWKKNIGTDVHRSSRTTLLFLAAYRELKQRREDEDWFRGEIERMIYVGLNGKFYIGKVDNVGNEFGPFDSIQSAIQAAKEGKK